MLIGIINAHMFYQDTEPGETDWTEADIMPESEWVWLLDTDIDSYASENPHMIVFECD